MTNIRYPQWRDENDNSLFPFEDRATLASLEGRSFSAGLFLDAILYPHGHVGGLFLSRIDVAADSITLVIGDDNQDEVASATFEPATSLGEVTVLDSAGRSAGILVSDPIRLSELQGWDVGSYTFDRSATPFIAAVCVPTPEVGVSGITLENGDTVSGDFWLVGGDGVVLEVDTAELLDEEGVARTYNVIRVHAVGDPLFKRRLCAPDRFATPRFVRRLIVQSGQRTLTVLPNAYGDIPITVDSRAAEDTVLRAVAVDNGLEIGVVGERLHSVR